MPTSPSDAQDIINAGYGAPGGPPSRTGGTSPVLPDTGPSANEQVQQQEIEARLKAGINAQAGATAGSPTGLSIEDLAKALGIDTKSLESILNGGSSGGSSGGGSAVDPMRSALESVYFNLWGKTPPEPVINQALSAGLNVFQFEDQIRQDPSFKRTETYQNEMADNVLNLARMLGMLPG